MTSAEKTAPPAGQRADAVQHDDVLRQVPRQRQLNRQPVSAGGVTTRLAGNRSAARQKISLRGRSILPATARAGLRCGARLQRRSAARGGVDRMQKSARAADQQRTQNAFPVRRPIGRAACRMGKPARCARVRLPRQRRRACPKSWQSAPADSRRSRRRSKRRRATMPDDRGNPPRSSVARRRRRRRQRPRCFRTTKRRGASRPETMWGRCAPRRRIRIGRRCRRRRGPDGHPRQQQQKRAGRDANPVRHARII